MDGGSWLRLRSRHETRVNARLLRSLTNGKPGRGHKAENDKEDEDDGERRGHKIITAQWHDKRSSRANGFKSRDRGYLLLNICYLI